MPDLSFSRFAAFAHTHWTRGLSIACVLATTIVANALPTTDDSRKVLIIGVDGLRPDQLIEARTPSIDALATAGAISHTATNAWTTDRAWNGHSATNWGTLLTGVSPGRSQLTHNGDGEHLVRDDEPTADSVLSLFGHLKIHDAKIETAVFNTWGGIGMGENTILAASQSVIDHHFHSTSDGAPAQRDRETTKATVDALLGRGAFQGADPDVVFLHLSQVDAAGHALTYNAPEYRRAVEAVDKLVGSVMDAMNARPHRDQEHWLVILTSDHGGPDDAKSHGDNSDPQVRTIPFAICADGASLTKPLGSPSLYDVAPTAVLWMGCETTPLHFDQGPLSFVEEDRSEGSSSTGGEEVGR